MGQNNPNSLARKFVDLSQGKTSFLTYATSFDTVIRGSQILATIETVSHFSINAKFDMNKQLFGATVLGSS